MRKKLTKEQQAEMKELQTERGISLAQARRIVEWREFRNLISVTGSVDDLRYALNKLADYMESR